MSIAVYAQKDTVLIGKTYVIDLDERGFYKKSLLTNQKIYITVDILNTSYNGMWSIIRLDNTILHNNYGFNFYWNRLWHRRWYHWNYMNYYYMNYCNLMHIDIVPYSKPSRATDIPTRHVRKVNALKPRSTHYRTRSYTKQQASESINRNKTNRRYHTTISNSYRNVNRSTNRNRNVNSGSSSISNSSKSKKN